jgi:hypothetical protein
MSQPGASLTKPNPKFGGTHPTELHLSIFFSSYFFGEPAVHCSQFSPLLPLTKISPGGNPPEDGQSAVGWGDAGFKPGTVGHQSGALPLSHHASQTT